jgi:NAD(P)-dependent dehydrogenase (short-subunit alcohol dehydrogenase family)
MADAKPFFRLTGKVAVVTGTARGIGRAASIALARAGADVAGLDIVAETSAILDFAPASEAELNETGRAVEAEGQRWRAMRVDQRNLAALRAAADSVAREFGGIDILFANAGIQAFKPILQWRDADWHDQIDVNLTGTANALRAFTPHIVERGGGRIIVTSSTQGQHGTKNGAAYSASKWGIIGLMKSAALEFGEYGITINALIPGLIDTALTRHEDRYAQAIETSGKTPSGDEAKDEETARKGLASKSPLGVPWIAPDDVAPMVVFLASDEARMVSGATFSVTAGDSANIES